MRPIAPVQYGYHNAWGSAPSPRYPNRLIVDNGRLCLYFPYDPVLVARAKSIPGAHWNKIRKCWDYPLSVHTYQLIKERFSVSLPQFENGNGSRAKIILGNRKYKTKPYDHQIEAIKFLLKQFGVDCDE